MQTLETGGMEERLSALLSGIGGAKLLGVPALPHKSTEPAGKLIAIGSIKLLVATYGTQCTVLLKPKPSYS